MSIIKKLSFVTLLGCLFCSCNSVQSNEWGYFVPDETPFIILPEQDATLQSALNSQYIPTVVNVSSSSVSLINSSVSLIKQIDSTAANPLRLKSILLYPGTNQRLQPIWIVEAPDNFMDNMKEAYARTYAQNKYLFSDVPILKIRMQQQLIFAAQLDDLLLISQSSLGVENAIRVYRGEQPGAYLEHIQMKPGSLIMNTPSLDEWITQQTQVIYSAAIRQSLNGTLPVLLEINQRDRSEDMALDFSGTISLSNQPASPLVEAISSQNRAITLDEYISYDAAAFAIFRLSPSSELPETLPDTTAIDSFFIDNTGEYRELSNSLSAEFAMVMYAESGLQSINEHAFIRKLENPDVLRYQLNTLADKGLLERIEDVYFARSYMLRNLIGSKLCNFSNFYIKLVDDVVIISERRGLAATIASDNRRRQTVIYEPFYEELEETFPGQPSGIVVGGSQLFTYLKPFLKSDNYIESLTSNFEYLAISTKKENDALTFTLSTFNIDSDDETYRENWMFSVEDAELTGRPVFADISGSATKEVIFATESGSVYVLSADGTVVQNLSTDGDQPVGSPVAYNWYDTGQNVILIAAGNKIYAWDESGELLPQFPFVLDENITTPIRITDINNNGLPDILVATANRRLHVLNARGNAVYGWPVTVNSVIRAKPLVSNFKNRLSVIAFASNAIHAWDATGNNLQGFPQFIDASFKGSPVMLDENILGASADGNLYTFGDSQTINVSSSSLTGTPLVTKERNIAVINTDGSIFLLNINGDLQLTKSMGQSPAPGWVPVITDLNNDGNHEVVALADYGRLYAWDLSSGERLSQLPTAAMSHVYIGDWDGNGLIEIVAQTEEGVQSWTLN